jgi:DNA-binding transcriptional regulator YiaG
MESFMSNLAVALRSEVRRLASREIEKALRAVRRVRKQVETLRLQNQGQRRALATLERRLARRVGAGVVTPLRGGVAVSATAIFALRRRLGMSRKAFARVVGVSPGSIFGWEKGRTLPRGGSVARLNELRRMGVRQIRQGAQAAGETFGGRRATRRRIRHSATAAARRARP